MTASIRYELDIAGAVVELHPIVGEAGWITSVRLVGPKEYNGHIHAIATRHGTTAFCLPNVIDSIGTEGRCTDPRVMREDGEGHIFAMWLLEDASAGSAVPVT